MRDATCAGCLYYGAAQQYQADRSQRISHAARPNGHFIAEMNPKVDDAVDAAMALCEQGKTDAAWAQVAHLLREHPRNHSVCYGMGVLHLLKEEHTKAIEWFDKAIAIFPYFVEAHFNRAAAYKKQLNLAETVYSFRKVLELGDPDDIPAQQARSFLESMELSVRKNNGVDLETYLDAQNLFDSAYKCMEQGDWSGALKGFQASAAKNERNPSTQGNLGLCFASLGYKAKSLAALDRALEIDPQYAPAGTNRAQVEQMKEGTPLQIAGIQRVDFGKSQFFDRPGGKQ